VVDPLVYDRPEFSAEEVAIIRGLLAKEHRHFHYYKNELETREDRDDVSAQMRRLEQISEKLGALL
jgi:tRNA isopentenyl-2-thiomethyl-A-37 hydroxylase MiaE